MSNNSEERLIGVNPSQQSADVSSNEEAPGSGYEQPADGDAPPCDEDPENPEEIPQWKLLLMVS